MSKKALIYARVSTEEQALNSRSLTSQLEDCHRYAAQHGFEVVEEIFDTYTGTQLERPNFDRVRRMAGTINAIIVWKQDRLGRADALDTLNLVVEFGSRGTEVHCSDTGLIQINDFMGQLMTMLRADAAKKERDNIVERSQRGRVARARAGKVIITTSAPYGYDYDRTSGQLIINEEQAQIVRLIYQWYLYGDEAGKRLGGYMIATKLTLMGIPTKTDLDGFNHSKTKKHYGVWGYTSVMKILRVETYCGVWHYNQRQRGNTATTRVWKDREKWIPVKVPAIVSREMWDAAQLQRKNNTVNSLRNTKNDYLLRGRIFCATCGYPHACKTDKRTNLSYYKCLGQEARLTPNGREAICHRSIRQNLADQRVWEALATMLKHPDLILEGIRQKRNELESQFEPDKVYLERCITQLEKLDAKRERLLHLYLDGKYEKEWLDSELALIGKQAEELKAKIAELRQRIEVIELTQDQETQMRDYCESAAQGIDLFTFEDRLAVVEVLEINVVIQRGDTPDDDIATLSGYIPTLKVKLSPNDDGGNGNGGNDGSSNGGTFGFTPEKWCDVGRERDVNGLAGDRLEVSRLLSRCG